MARSSAAPKVKIKPIVAVKIAEVKVPAMKPLKETKAHGMSLKVKADRTPHPTDPTRDVYGRKLPGNLMPNAAPPFTAQGAAPMHPVRGQAPKPAIPVFRAPAAQNPRVNLTPAPPVRPY